jgi:large subunit ribosomal protein L15
VASYSTVEKKYLKDFDPENNLEKAPKKLSRKIRDKQDFEKHVLEDNKDIQSIQLNNLTYIPGSRKKARRLGRGPGSSKGGTSGRGSHGQYARTSVNVPFLFEGGTVPLHRRLPKYGFSNRR